MVLRCHVLGAEQCFISSRTWGGALPLLPPLLCLYKQSEVIWGPHFNFPSNRCLEREVNLEREALSPQFFFKFAVASSTLPFESSRGSSVSSTFPFKSSKGSCIPSTLSSTPPLITSSFVGTHFAPPLRVVTVLYFYEYVFILFIEWERT